MKAIMMTGLVVLLAVAGVLAQGTRGSEARSVAGAWLSGELNGEQLSLEATDTPADKALELTATLKEDGTLAGYLSGPMGDMTWTASRVNKS